MHAYDIICAHTMCGSLSGTEAYFRQDGYGGVESHFGVGADGTVYQWQDTRYRADANYQGNDRVLSIETADKGPGFPAWAGSNVPPWTPAQIDALAHLVAFLCKTHSIPCDLVPNSQPGNRGVAYHRQGIDPWRVPGGQRWSTSVGKTCPGDRRIAQIPGIVAQARSLLGQPEQPIPAPAGGIYCRFGDRTDRVLKLQQFMTRVFASYNPYRPTGYFGEATRDGIEEFQRRVHITPDGIVGPVTLRELAKFGFQP